MVPSRGIGPHLTLLDKPFTCQSVQSSWKQLKHRVVEVWRDLWRSSCPSPQLKQGYLEPVAQDHVKMTFEYLQGTWRTCAWRICLRVEQGAGHPGHLAASSSPPTAAAWTVPNSGYRSCPGPQLSLATWWLQPWQLLVVSPHWSCSCSTRSCSKAQRAGEGTVRRRPLVTHVSQSPHLLCGAPDETGPAETAATKRKPSQILRASKCPNF